ncbi:MAG: AI-2E family transporter [Polyangiaceae bacterium]|jgi:predicted PurR-regulated permease PerM
MPQPPHEVDSRRRAERVALGILLGLTFLVVAWMAAPLLVGLALGTVMGFTAQPFHARLTARLGDRRALASAIATLMGGLGMVGVGAAVVFVIVRELAVATASLERSMAQGGGDWVGPHADRLLTALHLQREVVIAHLRDQLDRIANLAAQAAGVLVQASAGALLTLVMSLWTMYYVLVDGPRIGHHIERLLPLDPVHTRALVREFRDVGRRTFVGTVIGAFVQGVMAFLGFALCGIPQAPTWGALLAVLSFIPVVGVLLVWVPATIWLMTSGAIVRAVVLIGWNLIFVMAANDYVIKPRLVGRGGDSHPLLMLVALIGGISVFGVAGVIVGPVTMALFVATARIYEREREAEFEGEEEEEEGAMSPGPQPLGPPPARHAPPPP